MGRRKMKMDIINPHAAGIDIGSRSHFVAIGKRMIDVQEFGVFADDNQKLADWLSMDSETT